MSKYTQRDEGKRVLIDRTESGVIQTVLSAQMIVKLDDGSEQFFLFSKHTFEVSDEKPV